MHFLLDLALYMIVIYILQVQEVMYNCSKTRLRTPHKDQQEGAGLAIRGERGACAWDQFTRHFSTRTGGKESQQKVRARTLKGEGKQSAEHE